MGRRGARACVAVLIVAVGAIGAGAQLNKVAHDSNLDASSNKYLQREATADETGREWADEVRDRTAECGMDLALAWHAEIGDAVYATPIVTDLFSDGLRDVVVPGFADGLTVVEGRDGARAPTTFENWRKATQHASPLMYDMDFDGVLDIVTATYDGNVLFFRDNGQEAAYQLTVPRLRVKRDWFVGLHPDHVDHSHPDVGAGEGGGAAAADAAVEAGGDAAADTLQRRRRRLLQAGEEGAPGGITQDGAESFKELFEDDGDQEGEGEADPLPIGEGHQVQQERPHPTELAEADQHLGDGDYADADYHPRHHDPHDWDNEWDHPHHNLSEMHSEYLYLDPHIVATPAIADIDGDGKEDLVVSVSYYFDRNEYESADRKAELGPDVDLGMYVASGVVVWDLHHRMQKWSQHLDLSTDHTRYKAFAYGPPTLADVDGDGRLEVIVGTSMGFLYVLDPATGNALDGWPLQMGPIQAQVAVADINGDGALELIVGDTRGSIAAFTAGAHEVWETHLGSAITKAVTLGDVNGDGELEVVFGTHDGRIHVLHARDGRSVRGFPYQTFGKVTAPVLVTKLNSERSKSMQLVSMATDGLLYVVDGVSGCADTLDIGEHSFGMVLADDLTGAGRMDLLVTTANGNLYCVRTAARYHPLKTWTSQVLNSNGFISRWNWEGVYAVAESRRPRDARGQFLPVRFTVLDKRPGNGTRRAPYKISVLLQGVGVQELNMGDSPTIGMADKVNKSGSYTIEILAPRSRTTATVKVEMVDDNGLVFTDAFSLSFHLHFYRLFKWLIVGPFACSCIALLLMGNVLGDDEAIALPS